MIKDKNCKCNAKYKNIIIKTGWKCPGCNKCYSPYITQCNTCGKQIHTNKTTIDDKIYIEKN